MKITKWTRCRGILSGRKETLMRALISFIAQSSVRNGVQAQPRRMLHSFSGPRILEKQTKRWTKACDQFIHG